MSMIKVENLTFSYPSNYENIFENVNFQIDTDWKLGFVGRNGRGKTTFLNLLQGKYEYSGKITSSVAFDYFPYPVPDQSCLTEEILQNICPQAQEWELIRELSYLKTASDVLWRPFETLSNGEQTKALLAALFLNEGRFLLIDEPTNHLDAEARAMVSSYLKKKKGFLLVSHDRRFLDDCVDHILSLNRADIQVQSGNFSSWMDNFQRQQEFEQARNDRLQKEIGRLRQTAKRSAVWSGKVEASKIGAADKGFVGHKAAKMMKRSKSIEARQNQAIEEKSGLLKNVETAERLKMLPLTYHADTLVSFADAAVWYDGRMVCEPVSFAVRQHERIVLEGRNGSGKSSLLKILAGEDLQHTGTVSVGSGLVISYVPQDTSFLKGRLSDFAREQQIDETLFKALLRKLDFERGQFEKDMSEFSGGQKKKTLLARSLCQQAHLYVWDEPLNFVDVYSRIQIEELIKECSPTMLLVEHDGAFREQVATKIISI
ncbi:MAG: Lsa family ABC-F type ribosomal protection protein [Lachnospiraceae bacterium]|nr:Lsa family ABC-F type ribosomal protection protein [Lachnospiraceae bacterium]